MEGRNVLGRVCKEEQHHVGFRLSYCTICLVAVCSGDAATLSSFTLRAISVAVQRVAVRYVSGRGRFLFFLPSSTSLSSSLAGIPPWTVLLFLPLPERLRCGSHCYGTLPRPGKERKGTITFRQQSMMRISARPCGTNHAVRTVVLVRALFSIASLRSVLCSMESTFPTEMCSLSLSIFHIHSLSILLSWCRCLRRQCSTFSDCLEKNVQIAQRRTFTV